MSDDQTNREGCAATPGRAALDPIDVCSLDPEALAERIAWVRLVLVPHVLGRVRLPQGVALELEDAPGVSDRVDHWIELERRCCGGIRWARGVPSAASRHRIEIEGVDPDGPLFAAFPLLGVECSPDRSESTRRSCAAPFAGQ